MIALVLAVIAYCREFFIGRRDRDAKFCSGFDNVLASEGVHSLRLPPRCPNPECLRRKVGAFSRARVLFRAHPVWGTLVATGSDRIYHAFSLREKSSAKETSYSSPPRRRRRTVE